MKLDFHSHILPGIDDGAKDINESLMLAKALKDWGFDRITCTPHITDLYKNTPEKLRSVQDCSGFTVYTVSFRRIDLFQFNY